MLLGRLSPEPRLLRGEAADLEAAAETGPEAADSVRGEAAAISIAAAAAPAIRPKIPAVAETRFKARGAAGIRRWRR